MSNEFKARLSANVKMVQAASPGARDIAVVRNVSGSKFVESPDTVMLQVLAILITVDRIYRYGKNIILDMGNELIVLVENGNGSAVGSCSRSTPCVN